MTESLSTRKRRPLKIILSAIAALAVVGGTLAYAHGNMAGHGGMMSEQGIEMHLDHVQAMLTRIGASDAQKSPVDAPRAQRSRPRRGAGVRNCGEIAESHVISICQQSRRVGKDLRAVSRFLQLRIHVDHRLV